MLAAIISQKLSGQYTWTGESRGVVLYQTGKKEAFCKHQNIIRAILGKLITCFMNDNDLM
jgi:hypothetical protein